MDKPILSKNHLKSLLFLHKKKYRERENRYLIEGRRLCEDALDSDVKIQEFIICEEEIASGQLEPILSAAKKREIAIYSADKKQLSQISDTKTPQGIAAVVGKNDISLDILLETEGGLLIGIDGIRDPGNLGTIIRTADWFAVRGFLLSKDTVELYNPKVVRSTMGSIFRVPACENIDLVRVVPDLKNRGYRIIATLAGSGTPSHEITRGKNDLIILGSEAEGISDSLRTFIDINTTIPRIGGGESLNVAVAIAIILYQLNRKN